MGWFKDGRRVQRRLYLVSDFSESIRMAGLGPCTVPVDCQWETILWRLGSAPCANCMLMGQPFVMHTPQFVDHTRVDHPITLSMTSKRHWWLSLLNLPTRHWQPGIHPSHVHPPLPRPSAPATLVCFAWVESMGTRHESAWSQKAVHQCTAQLAVLFASHCLLVPPLFPRPTPLASQIWFSFVFVPDIHQEYCLPASKCAHHFPILLVLGPALPATFARLGNNEATDQIWWTWMARCLRWNTLSCLFQNLQWKMRQYRGSGWGYQCVWSQGMGCVIATSYEGYHTDDGPIGKCLCLESYYSRIQMTTAHSLDPWFTIIFLVSHILMIMMIYCNLLHIHHSWSQNLSYNSTFSARYWQYSKNATSRWLGSLELPKIGSRWSIMYVRLHHICSSGGNSSLDTSWVERYIDKFCRLPTLVHLTTRTLQTWYTMSMLTTRRPWERRSSHNHSWIGLWVMDTIKYGVWNAFGQRGSSANLWNGDEVGVGVVGRFHLKQCCCNRCAYFLFISVILLILCFKPDSLRRHWT